MAEEVAELQAELYSVLEARRALAESLAYTRARIRESGSVRHRPGATGRRGYTAAGRSSESSYRDLLERRAADRAHDAHLRAEAASLRRAVARVRARGRRRRSAA